MPVFHFTLHAYRSWNADHPRGYVQRGEPGVKAANVPLGRARERLSRFPEVAFDPADTIFLVKEAHDVTARRGLTLYGVTAIATHLHLAAGWKGQRDEHKIQGDLKKAFGYVMAKRKGTKGLPYFSRGGNPERVKDMRHLHYLLYEYFPGHRGAMWRVELEPERLP